MIPVDLRGSGAGGPDGQGAKPSKTGKQTSISGTTPLRLFCMSATLGCPFSDLGRACVTQQSHKIKSKGIFL